MHTENGLIESTVLGPEDHGIMSCMIHIKFNGTGQGFGGYAFDGPPPKGTNGDRRGSAFGMDFIMRVMETVGVRRWEDLPGKHVRVRRASEFGRIDAIGHIVEDRWFSPAELGEEHGD